MTLLYQLAALGYIPGILALGASVLRRIQSRNEISLSPVERLGLSAVIGGCCFFPFLFLAAWFGIFYPSLNGLVGWIVFLGLNRDCIRLLKASSASQIGLLAFALSLFAWNATFSTESIFSGRDQGVYSNLAAHIATEHWIFDDPPYEKLFEGDNFFLAQGGVQGGGYFFLRSRGFVYFQFPPTTAIHMAQLYGIGGYNGLFAFNALLGSLNFLLFYALARRLLGDGKLALLASLFFSLNAAQVWNVRITLSEPLAQTLLTSGLLALAIGLKEERRQYILLGAVIASANAFVRIDGLLAAAGINIALAYLAIFEERREKQRALNFRLYTKAAFAAAATSLLAALFGFLTSRGYYNDFTSKIVAMIAVSFIFAMLTSVPLPEGPLVRLKSLIRTNAFVITIIALVSAVAIYAYFIRPYIEPFAEFPEGKRLTGRDYRELSLVHLSAYLSFPIVALAVVGYCMSVRQILQKRAPALAMLAAVWSVFALLYLYAPQISPDHPWRIRRFTPIIIPGFCLFAAVPLKWAIQRFAPRASGFAIATIGGSVFLILTLNTIRPIAFTKLHKGAARLIHDISDQIAPGSLVVTDLEKTLWGPLYLAEGHSIIRAKTGSSHHAKILDNIIADELTNDRPILYATKTPLTNEQSPKSKDFHLSYRYLVGHDQPPPVMETDQRNISVYLTQVSENALGYSKDDQLITIGAHPILGVVESGLHNQERSGRTFFRWTTGDARFSLPWIFDHPPLALTFSALSASPNGTNTGLFVNGKKIYEGTIPNTGAELQLPLDSIDWQAKTLHLRIQCETWSPASVEPNATDSRKLGIQLGGFHFKMKRDDLLKEVSFGDAPVYGIKEEGLHDTEYHRGTDARWTDGDAHFEMEFDPSFRPTQMEIKLLSINPEKPVPLLVLWNGQIVFETEPLREASTISFQLESWNQVTPNELTLKSEPFVPSEQDPTSSDNRKLGVMIDSIRITGETIPD